MAARRGINPFTGMAAACCIVFVLCLAGTMVAFVQIMVDSFDAPSAEMSDAEVVMYDIGTKEVTGFGLTVPRDEAKNVRLDLNGDIVTFYSNGVFKTYDIGSQQTVDSYTPSNGHYAQDPYKSSGTHLAFYSSVSDSITIRETVPAQGSTPGNEVKVQAPAENPGAKLIATDGSAFYWSTDDAKTSGSVIYKYDPATDTTTKVHSVRADITDMAAGNGKVAYSTDWNRVSKVYMVDLSKGTTMMLCQNCARPRMDGDLLAALMQVDGHTGQTTILVQNTTTGKGEQIKEDDEVTDVDVDDDRVGWSWIREVDPITVHNVKTGKETTYQPDHMVYTFAMSGNRIVMLRSIAKLPQTTTVLTGPAQIGARLTITFLFGTVFMSGMAIALSNQRRKEELAVANKEARAVQEFWNEQWRAYYQSQPATYEGGWCYDPSQGYVPYYYYR